MAEGSNDTIFALSTAPGMAAVAIVRLSGAGATEILARLCGPLPPPRVAALRTLRDAEGDVVDRALVVRFEAGASYTGETMAEIQCHGGLAVISSVTNWLARQPGCRPAEPGEFTRRALLAGRVDLTEVEALGDLIAAETEEQRKQALRGMSDGLKQRALQWRAELLHALMLIEVTIDWADEEVPERVGPEAAACIDRVIEAMEREIAGSAAAERVREGFEVALIGAPNSGKSSLFNYLAGRSAAITSPTPGTTRDILELRYDLAGLPVTFLDTAGLRDTSDALEAEGVARARERAAAADLRVLLVAPDAPRPDFALDVMGPDDLEFSSKADRPDRIAGRPLSVRTGEGVADLLRELQSALALRVREAGVVTTIRQRIAVERSRAALIRARSGIDTLPDEVVAEEIRQALSALAVLAGEAGVEDVLDAVFSKFCLGK